MSPFFYSSSDVIFFLSLRFYIDILLTDTYLPTSFNHPLTRAFLPPRPLLLSLLFPSIPHCQVKLSWSGKQHVRAVPQGERPRMEQNGPEVKGGAKGQGYRGGVVLGFVRWGGRACM